MSCQRRAGAPMKPRHLGTPGENEASFKLLARSARYGILDNDNVEQHLRGDVFYPVPSSLSGPQKHAADWV